MPDGDIYRISIVQTTYGVGSNNTFFFKQNGPDEGAMRTQVDAFIDSLQDSAWYSAWRANVSAVHNFICWEANRVLPMVGLPAFQFTADPGTDPIEAHAPKNTVIVSMQSDSVFTKRGRRRNWFSGIPEDQTSGGRLQQSPYLSWKNWNNNNLPIPFIYGGGDFSMQVVTQRTMSGAPMATTDVGNFEVRPRIYTLMSRDTELCAGS